jgi:hypothetical protein
MSIIISLLGLVDIIMQPNNRESILRARDPVPASHSRLLPYGRDAKSPPRTHGDAVDVAVNGDRIQGFDPIVLLSDAYLSICINIFSEKRGGTQDDDNVNESPKTKKTIEVVKAKLP